MERDYLIWSNEHRRWWAPGHCGYVQKVSNAGRYTRREAMSICRDAIPSALHVYTFAELPVRLADVEEFVAGQLVPSELL